MKVFDEYIIDQIEIKSSLYKDLTGREPSDEELIEFLRTEYNHDLVQELKSSRESIE